MASSGRTSSSSSRCKPGANLMGNMHIGSSLLFGAALCMPLAAFAAAEPSANYPARPIRLVVPQNPGGGTDLYARLVALPLSKRMGQSIVIDNRAGAGSLIGTDLVAKAVPDGYTLLAVSSAISIIPSVMRQV